MDDHKPDPNDQTPTTATIHRLEPKKNGRSPTGLPADQRDNVEELPWPFPSDWTPAQMFKALGRTADQRNAENAFLIMTRSAKCPCGCGKDIEEIELICAGPQSSTNERLLWIGQRVIDRATGKDYPWVDQEDDYDDGA